MTVSISIPFIVEVTLMENVGIVICNFNKQDYVLGCIASVLDQTYTDYKIYVVDNASTDDSVKLISEKYGDKVTLLVNSENLGGSGGFDRGMREAMAAGHPYIWCLDNDVLVDENALKALVEYAEAHPEAGMFGSKVYNMDDPDTIQQYGVMVNMDDFSTTAKHVNEIEAGENPEIEFCNSCATCSLMARREVIEKIGVMPEDNFIYWDDIEWGYKCHLAGYDIVSIQASQVLHQQGANKEIVNTFPTYYAWRNWIHFFNRYLKDEELDKWADTILHSVFMEVYSGLFRDEHARARAVMAAYDDALHGVRGKARDGIIGPIDKNNKMQSLTEKVKTICIEENGYPIRAERYRNKILSFNPNVEFTTDPTKPYDVCFSLVDSVFYVEDFSLKKFYVDIDEDIISNEDDILMIINFNYSERAFTFSQKPMFLQLVRELRAKLGITN